MGILRGQCIGIREKWYFFSFFVPKWILRLVVADFLTLKMLSLILEL